MSKKQVIRKSNALVEASYHLTATEQRVLLLAIAKLPPKEPISSTVFYPVTVEEYAALSQVPVQDAYRDLKRGAKRLRDRSVTLYEYPNGAGTRPDEKYTGWVQTAEIPAGGGRVGLKFTDDILPYITELSRQFTTYPLGEVGRLDSSYALRLYEVLMQWKDTGSREVSVDWLRQRFELAELYPAYKDFRVRVIETAVRQINERTSLRVTWKPRKTGRKVTHLQFTFTVPKTPAAPVSPGKAARGGDTIKGIPKALIEQRARPGESYPACAERLIAERQRAKR